MHWFSLEHMYTTLNSTNVLPAFSSSTDGKPTGNTTKKRFVEIPHFLGGNISDANQLFCENYANLDLNHRINIQGKGAWRGGGDLQKCD